MEYPFSQDQRKAGVGDERTTCRVRVHAQSETAGSCHAVITRDSEDVVTDAAAADEICRKRMRAHRKK